MTLHAFCSVLVKPMNGMLDVLLTIWPDLALFLMSMTSFFSLCSSLVRSRSSSRWALVRDLWCCRRRSAGVTLRPNSVSMMFMVMSKEAPDRIYHCCGICCLELSFMDLSHIGAHCAVSSCNVRDFLPIYCECQQKFCSDHISPELHNCSSLKANTEELKTFSDKIQRCSVADCGKPSLNGINGATGETCSACHAALCVA